MITLSDSELIVNDSLLLLDPQRRFRGTGLSCLGSESAESKNQYT